MPDISFQGCSSLYEVDVTDGVTEIGDDAFLNCAGLTEVKLPDTVSVIGMSAFWGCSSLTEITIPSSVTEIGDNAFMYSGVSTINFTGTSEQWKAIEGSSDLTRSGLRINCIGTGTQADPDGGECGENADWSFEGGVLTISGTGEMESYNGLDSASRQPPWGDFRNDISEVIIENGITSIGAYAFAKCRNLVAVEVPSSVQKIGIYAFQDCEKLEEVMLPEGVDYKSNFAFQGCNTKITY